MKKYQDYLCECCHRVFAYTEQDELEALVEFALDMNVVAKPGEPLVVVCDDCYEQILKWAKTHGPHHE